MTAMVQMRFVHVLGYFVPSVLGTAVEGNERVIEGSACTLRRN